MKTYVGIDLGTTNSAICTYDGEKVRLYKNPDNTDVTPSAIYIDKRSKRIGVRAYQSAAHNPDNAAIKFKRLMGTTTPIKLSAVNVVMTPEECSAEILRYCWGFLPEDIRNDPDIGTVITVPAAFNTMQKDATLAAAEMAGLGKVALMQEPVAAVMSVMHHRRTDGLFLVYDLGGGTLDISVAQSTSGRVSLLSHGGIAMCGGSDFDRAIVEAVVKPWLQAEFTLPADFAVSTKYKPLLRLAAWASEMAKIELSSREEAQIMMSETEINLQDEAGKEIYLDVVVDRQTFNRLIADKIDESINATREAIEKANQTSATIERIVWVGGPTKYQPLCDKVAFELGIQGSNEVNPMTAVAEGAAIFAESIDWSTQSRGRKSARGAVNASGKLELSFHYIARTPNLRARVIVKLGSTAQPGTEFQIESMDTGWSSGRLALKDGASLELVLGKVGENTFKAFVFDDRGGMLPLENSKIVITQTAATIDAIPASASLSIEVMQKGVSALAFLVREGDPLPKKGTVKFLAGESLRAGGKTKLNFILREGDIEDTVSDNECIGELAINGHDFDEGVIAQGADLICDYEVLDSGQIILNVSVPSIGGTFGSGVNFYSRTIAGRDFSNAAPFILASAQELRARVEAIGEQVDDPKIALATKKLDQVETIDSRERDPETAKQAMDNVQSAKKLLAEVRKTHTRPIRQMELNNCLAYFEGTVRANARPAEESAYDMLARTAQRAIDAAQRDFESLLQQLRVKNFTIMFRQDWWAIDRFNLLAAQAWRFADPTKHAELIVVGRKAVEGDDMQTLRITIYGMYDIMLPDGNEAVSVANITTSLS